jgi:peroxiredoxin
MGHGLSLLVGARSRASLAVVAALCLSSCTSAPAPTNATGTIEMGPLPNVPLTSLAGEPTDVGRLAAGRVALVSLWATWCDACEAEMDALNRLDAKTSGGHDAVVIGVAVGEERDKVAAFARRRGLRYALLVDETFAFADALGQRRIPATLVVDRTGRVVFRGDTLDAASLEALSRAIAAPGEVAP